MITDETQPGEDDSGLSRFDRTEMEKGAALPDWNLLEASLEAEEQLGDIASQYAGIDKAIILTFVIHILYSYVSVLWLRYIGSRLSSLIWLGYVWD